MNRKQLRAQCRPHLWFQLYWVVYLIWFFWLDLTITDPKYIIHSRIDDRIPFNEWFIFPYCSWFLLLAGVTALLWWCDTQSYDKLCLTMFSGMTFCLILYMLLPNGLELRPTAEDVERSNIAMSILQLIWKADASVNVCPSIHCQSSACMALWAALICASTVFTKQHSIIDVVCGLAVAFVWCRWCTALREDDQKPPAGGFSCARARTNGQNREKNGRFLVAVTLDSRQQVG